MQQSNCARAVALAAGALLAAAAATAEIRQAGKHEHGTTNLGIAVEGTSLTIELDGPAANFLGFEHRPASDAEKQQLAKVLNILRDGAALFGTPPGAACRLQSSAVSPPEYGASGHADLEAFWEFRCGSPPALTWVEAKLFAAFPANLKVSTSIVTDRGQKAVVLTPGTTRALLPP